MVHLAIVAGLLMLAASNFAYSLRRAFTAARDNKGGGYPIMMHVMTTFVTMFCILILLPRIGGVPKWVTSVAVVSMIAVPTAHALLIAHCARLGDSRAAA